MKKTLLYFAAALFLITTGVAQTIHPGCEDGKIYLKYKFNALKKIKVKDPLDIPFNILPGLEQLAGVYGIKHVEKPFYQAIDSKDLQRIFKIEFTNKQMVDALIRDLSGNAMIEYAEKIPIMTLDYTPNDPSLGTQWHLTKINAAGAWNVFNGNSNITVAVVDNAIQYTHPDLTANIWVNPGEIAGNGIDDDNNGYVDDVKGYDVGDNDNNVLPVNLSWDHGTHCSGIVGARTDNGVGIAAIGFNVKIIPVKATANSAGSTAVSNGYGGIIYAARNKAKVISCSWGGTVSAVTDQSVIDYAWNKGCVVVAAAGNNGNNVLNYPGAYNNVLCVASTGNTDVKSSFSSYGPWVDVSAPGENIYSTVPYNSYGNMSGTSMATPLVSGLAGLILCKNPAMTPAAVVNCIKSTAAAGIYTISGNSAYSSSQQLGTGRIDAFAAMNCAASSTTSPPVAEFYSNIQATCPGNPIQFYDQSYFSPASWSWSFPGASVTTSTLQNPLVTYTAAGTYSVSLTVTNGFGNNSITKTAYITITVPGALPLVEGFQGAAWPPAGWTIDDKFQDSVKWSRQTSVGGFGNSSASAIFDNYYNDATGSRDLLNTPKYDFSAISNARIRFDVAYARYDATYSDSLQLLVSTNCGNSWTSAYFKGGTNLSTAPDYTVDLWVPTATQWRRDSVDVSALVAGQSNVMFSFANHGHYGQGIYLDNVNLAYTLAAVPAANFNTPANPCSGTAITFTDASTNSPSSWLWNFPGATVSTSTVQNPSVTYSVGGVYNVTLTATNAAGSNAVVKSITITAAPTLTASATSSAICAGSTVTLTASGASTYTWNPGGSGSSISVTPTANTVYTVTGTSGNCNGTTTKNITVNANPFTSVTSSNASCFGMCDGIVTVNAAGGAPPYMYSWSMGIMCAATTCTALCPGSYTCTVTDANACVGIGTVAISQPAPITGTLNSVNATCGTCSDGSITATTSGGSGPYTYSWSPVAGNTPNLYNVLPGCYSLTVTDMMGCAGNFTNCVSFSSGINSIATSVSGTIYVMPNPNTGIFTVKADLENAFDVKVYNSIGQLVKEENNVRENAVISLSEYGRGIYNVIVKVNSNYTTIKVVVE